MYLFIVAYVYEYACAYINIHKDHMNARILQSVHLILALRTRKRDPYVLYYTIFYYAIPDYLQ